MLITPEVMMSLAIVQGVRPAKRPVEHAQSRDENKK
jgi:hypothetical protein